jgi:Skp family chaperone for outer membrane proteins
MLKASRINTLVPLMLVLAAAIAWHAGANTAAQRPPAQPTAVATIDIVEIFERLNERTHLEAQLEDRRKSREAQLAEVRDRVESIKNDIETVHPLGSDASKEAIREFMEQNAVLKARGEALGQIMSIDQGNIRRQLFEKVVTAVQKIADRDSIDIVILDDSAFPLPDNNSSNIEVFRAIVSKSVIYAHPTVDLTDRVITLMNNEFTAP